MMKKLAWGGRDGAILGASRGWRGSAAPAHIRDLDEGAAAEMRGRRLALDVFCAGDSHYVAFLLELGGLA